MAREYDDGPVDPTKDAAKGSLMLFTIFQVVGNPEACLHGTGPLPVTTRTQTPESRFALEPRGVALAQSAALPRLSRNSTAIKLKVSSV
jgi:hypothetical protein